MATITETTTQVEKQITVMVDEPVLSVLLTPSEAAFIAAVLGSRNGIQNSLWDAFSSGLHKAARDFARTHDALRSPEVLEQFAYEQDCSSVLNASRTRATPASEGYCIKHDRSTWRTMVNPSRLLPPST